MERKKAEQEIKRRQTNALNKTARGTKGKKVERNDVCAQVYVHVSVCVCVCVCVVMNQCEYQQPLHERKRRAIKLKKEDRWAF